MDHSTIAAVATPAGYGGIGIIKISGDYARTIAERVFSRSARPLKKEAELRMPSIASHHLYHGYIIDPEKGNVIDEVLLSVMLAPHTYTKEDVVEIQAHSGPIVLQSILDLVLRYGARLAEPGEFTKRSFLNGRIDLTQAEAVIDLINAKTKLAVEIAAVQLKGDIASLVSSIRSRLLDVLTEIEAGIDFPDEIEEVIDNRRLSDILQQDIISRLKALIRRHQAAHVFRAGIRAVIVGKPNVGKSSLLNCLIQKDRAIVTSVPGTTRDVIDETCIIRNIPVTLSDTAGMHETKDSIEKIGIQKTVERISDSDLILFIVDASAPLSEEDLRLYEQISQKPIILIQNKIDLIKDESEMPIPLSWRNLPTVRISALYDMNIERLRHLIVKIVGGETGIDLGERIVPNMRHKLALERALTASTSVANGLQNKQLMELVAIDIKEAVDSLGEIIGIAPNRDVLDEIFSKFCIGK